MTNIQRKEFVNNNKNVIMWLKGQATQIDENSEIDCSELYYAIKHLESFGDTVLIDSLQYCDECGELKHQHLDKCSIHRQELIETAEASADEKKEENYIVRQQVYL